MHVNSSAIKHIEDVVIQKHNISFTINCGYKNDLYVYCEFNNFYKNADMTEFGVVDVEKTKEHIKTVFSNLMKDWRSLERFKGDWKLCNSQTAFIYNFKPIEKIEEKPSIESNDEFDAANTKGTINLMKNVI